MVEVLTIMPFIFVMRTGRGFMDGSGSEKIWAFSKVSFERYPKARSYMGSGDMLLWENFKILDARIALVVVGFRAAHKHN